MGLRINTNVAAMNAHRNLSKSDSNMAKSLERLSSGYRINKAADDAAGLSISNKLSVQTRAMSVASRNASQANSMLQVAEGGMDQTSNMLERLKELATQAASSNNSSNLTDIDEEATALINEINRIGNSTTFQGTALLTGFGTHTTANTLTVDNTYSFDVSNSSQTEYSVTIDTAAFSITITDLDTATAQTLTSQGDGATSYDFSQMGVSFKTSTNWIATANLSGVGDALDGFSVDVANADFQIGETNNSNYRISFQIDDVRASALSVGSISLATASGAQSAMDSIDNALTSLNTTRGKIGAIQNRLGYTSANLATAVENVSAAVSVIKDVDMASEMTNFTKNQILTQAGTAMLAQANMAPQQVLSLIG